jgi:hypothetical protein
MAKDNTTTMLAVAEEQATALTVETTALLASAEQFEIVTNDQYTSSADLLKQIKGKQTGLDDLRKSITRPLDEAKARIMDLFRPAGNQLIEAERTLKHAMLGFTRQQENIRQQEENRARELADKEAARLQRRADKAREAGKDDKADELETQALAVPTPIIPSSTARVSGIVQRATWKAEVTDLKALVVAVAAGQAPVTLLLPNMPVLNMQARSLKRELNIPGVRAVSEDVVAARGQ